MFARPSILTVALCALVFLLPAEGSADKEKHKKSKNDHHEKKSELGDYHGVHAGNSSITPPGAHGKGRGKNRPMAYWVGFSPREGGSSRVFVQLGTDVGAQQWIEGNTLVVHLPKIRIGNRTVQRFLDTRYFDTAIKQIRVKSVRPRRPKGDKPGHDSGLQLHFDFKNPEDVGQASLTTQNEADGYNYLYLDFGAGTAMPEMREDDH